jgi:hypothetical protein
MLKPSKCKYGKYNKGNHALLYYILNYNLLFILFYFKI